MFPKFVESTSTIWKTSTKWESDPKTPDAKERSLAQSLGTSLGGRDSRGTSRPESVLSYHFVKTEVADVAKPGDGGREHRLKLTLWGVPEKRRKRAESPVGGHSDWANCLTPVLWYDRTISIKIRGIKTRLKDVLFFLFHKSGKNSRKISLKVRLQVLSPGGFSHCIIWSSLLGEMM